jgi:hypothetical protein
MSVSVLFFTLLILGVAALALLALAGAALLVVRATADPGKP